MANIYNDKGSVLLADTDSRETCLKPLSTVEEMIGAMTMEEFIRFMVRNEIPARFQ